jgi:hypothetical protein
MKVSLLALSTLLLLCQCESGPIDSRYPSIAQQDSLDAQWGLKKRKTKGAPRQFIPASMMPKDFVDETKKPKSESTPAAPSAPETDTPVAPASDTPEKVDTSVLDKLR